MRQVVIENPVINSPFEEAKRHFRFDDEGITDEIVEERRVSCYFVPIARPRKKGKAKQLLLDAQPPQRALAKNVARNVARNGGFQGTSADFGGLTGEARDNAETFDNARERAYSLAETSSGRHSQVDQGDGLQIR